jgi:hypothetical protein
VVKSIHQLAKAIPQTISREEFAIRLARRRESINGADSFWHKRAKEFTQARTLPANKRNVVCANFAQIHNELIF